MAGRRVGRFSLLSAPPGIPLAHPNIALVTCFVALALIASCASFSRPPTFRERLAADSTKYQSESGLFVSPEASGPKRPDIVASSQVEQLIGPLIIPSSHASLEPVDTDLASFQARLRLKLARDQHWAAGAKDRELFRGLEVPDAQPDTGAEVGVLWHWADSFRLVRDPGSEPVVPDDIRHRIEQIAGRDLTPSPYLVLRMMEAREALGLPPDPRLTALKEHQAAQPLPRPDADNALWDALALLTFGATPHESSIPEWTEALTRSTSGRAAGNLVEVAASVKISQLLGLSQPEKTGKELIRSAIDPQTGLISADSTSPSVDATYIFARLLDQQFSNVASQNTLTKLKDTAENPATDPITRARAVYSLKKARKQIDALLSRVTDESKELPREVRQDDVGSYIDWAEALQALGVEFTPGRLVPFSAEGSSEIELLAVSALQFNYLFSNPDAIPSLFTDLVTAMRAWPEDASLPAAQRLTAMAALAMLPSKAPSGRELDRYGDLVEQMRGCADSPLLISVDGTKDGTCSIKLTAVATSLPNNLE